MVSMVALMHDVDPGHDYVSFLHRLFIIFFYQFFYMLSCLFENFGFIIMGIYLPFCLNWN